MWLPMWLSWLPKIGCGSPKKRAMDQKSVILELLKKHSFKNSTFCHYNCQYQGFAMHEGSLQSLSKKAILDLGTEKRDNFNSLQASTAVCLGQACLHKFTSASFDPSKFINPKRVCDKDNKRKTLLINLLKMAQSLCLIYEVASFQKTLWFS